jgi:hypothetical protein
LRPDRHFCLFPGQLPRRNVANGVRKILLKYERCHVLASVVRGEIIDDLAGICVVDRRAVDLRSSSSLRPAKSPWRIPARGWDEPKPAVNPTAMVSARRTERAIIILPMLP